jgi:hypothetical protein
MGIKNQLVAVAMGLCLATSIAGVVVAQGVPLPTVVPPTREFATSEEHYKFLLDQADGGTQHTVESVPKWEGLWSPGGNTMFSLFIENGTMAMAMAPVDAVVKEGVLTPEYEEAFKARRAQMVEFGEQPYDRLTHCEYPGLARWFWEPYTREFVNTPTQSYWMNDFMNESRRVFIGAEHANPYGTHSSTGDSIGFWNGNKLIVNTKYVLPADYLRGAPLTSNQLETVEIWEMKLLDNGTKRLEVQVTFYDKHALIKPVTAVYTYNPRDDLEAAGVRIRNWECETTSNSYIDENGNTNYFLPGDPGFQDARGTTAFPDLAGQSRDPLNEGVGADGMPELEGGN